jgi:hypothetical protein
MCAFIYKKGPFSKESIRIRIHEEEPAEGLHTFYKIASEKSLSSRHGGTESL